MMLSLVVSVGWMAWRNKTLLCYITSMTIGLIVAFMPFAIAFTCWGNWHDMWQEYFANTMASVSVPMSETLSVYAQEWLSMITTRRCLYLLYVLPVLLLWKRKEWFTSALPALCGLFFIALSIRHDQFGHYISAVGPFAILAIIVLFLYLKQYELLRLRYVAVVGLLLVGYICWGSIRYTDSFCTKAGEKFDKYMAVSEMMSQVEQPRIIIVGQERGVCMASALPGTRYWITQMGRTEKMWQEQMAALDSGVADYVILFGSDSPAMKNRVERIGYCFLDEFYGGRVYARSNDIPVITPIHFSAWDIITKKTYKEVYGL